MRPLLLAVQVVLVVAVAVRLVFRVGQEILHQQLHLKAMREEMVVQERRIMALVEAVVLAGLDQMERQLQVEMAVLELHHQ